MTQFEPHVTWMHHATMFGKEHFQEQRKISHTHKNHHHVMVPPLTLSFSVSVCLSFSISVHVSLYVSMSLSLSLYLSVYASISLYLCVSLSLPLCLFLYVSQRLSLTSIPELQMPVLQVASLVTWPSSRKWMLKPGSSSRMLARMQIIDRVTSIMATHLRHLATHIPTLCILKYIY